MAIYVFRCPKCEKEFEITKSAKLFTETAQCSCGEEAPIVIQKAGIIFEGGGFYETDYKERGKKKN